MWWEALEPAFAARSGDVVLLYHLLWELTHVCFEHPGLLKAAPAAATPSTTPIPQLDLPRESPVGKVSQQIGLTEIAVEGEDLLILTSRDVLAKVAK